MKRLMPILTGALVMLFLGSAPLLAQKPHGEARRRGEFRRNRSRNARASGDHGNGGGNSAKTGGKGAAASSPTTVLTKTRSSIRI